MRTKSYQTWLIFNGIIQKKLKRRLSGGGRDTFYTGLGVSAISFGVIE